MPMTAELPINAGDFDDLMERIELSRSVAISRKQFENGEFIPHDEVMRNMQDMLNDLKARGAAKSRRSSIACDN